MTERLYYQDPALLSCDAVVLRAEPEDGNVAVYLDRTPFYPEGGGQPADRGTIAGIPVLDVRKSDGGEIVHVLSGDPGRGRVRCEVDGEHRFDFMQQHTGQHIVSAALLEAGGFDTVSVHLGEEYTAIEVDAADIAPGLLGAVEERANEIIRRNLPVRIHWTSGSDVERFALRRPPQVQGEIRVVEIQEVDCAACGGLHVSSTGRVGLVRLTGVERIRGRLRLAWKIGRRADREYRGLAAMAADLSASLSVRPEEISGRVTALRQELRDAEVREHGLEERLAAALADLLVRDAGSPAADDSAAASGTVIARRLDGEPKGLFRALLTALSRRPPVAACLVNVSDEGMQWGITVARGDSGAFGGFDFGEVRNELLPLIEGKGGGRDTVWQGAGSRPEEADAFLDRFRELAAGRWR